VASRGRSRSMLTCLLERERAARRRMVTDPYNNGGRSSRSVPQEPQSTVHNPVRGSSEPPAPNTLTPARLLLASGAGSHAIPKLDRTMTDIYSEELYSHWLATGGGSLSQPSQSAVSPGLAVPQVVSTSSHVERRRTATYPVTYRCMHCPRRFHKAHDLRSHLQTHTVERPFVCAVCGNSYTRMDNKKRHERSCKKKFVCKDDLHPDGRKGCKKRFVRADSLERHRRVCRPGLFSADTILEPWPIQQMEPQDSTEAVAGVELGWVLGEHSQGTTAVPDPDPYPVLHGEGGSSAKSRDDKQEPEAAANDTALAAKCHTTDSGYASAPNFSLPATTQGKDRLSSSTNPEEGDDTRTEYSAATTVLDDSAHQCIVDICKDIYAKIRGHMDDKIWSSISREMPFRIKSFALQLGHGSADDVSRRIMVFVHRRHQ